MKKTAVLLLCLCIFLCGCSQKSAMLEIQNMLTDMQGYSCNATLTRTTPSGQKVYETKQYFDADGRYRLELTAPSDVAGNYTVFDGERIAQYNPRIQSSLIHNVPASRQRNELFLGQFIKNYLQSEGVSVQTASLDESRCTVLEALIPQAQQDLASEKLWVDTETLLPVRLVIYNTAGEECYRLDYTDFVYNPELDEELFTIAE